MTRRLLRWLAGTVLVLLLLVGLALLATQTGAFRAWLRDLVEAQVSARMVDGDITIGALDGNLLTGAQLRDVTIRQAGREVVAIDRVAVEYRVPRLLGSALSIGSVTMTRPRIVLVHDRSGWRMARLFRTDPSAPPTTRTFTFESLTVEDGTLTIDEQTPVSAQVDLPERLTSLNADLALSFGTGGADLNIARAGFVTRSPGLQVRSVAGRVVSGDGRVQLDHVALRTPGSVLDVTGTLADDAVSATVSAAPLDLDEVARFVPTGTAEGLRPSLEATLSGRLDALQVIAHASEPSIGVIQTDATVDARASAHHTHGVVRFEQLNLAPLLDSDGLDSRLTGEADFDLQLPVEASDRLAVHAAIRSTRSAFAGYRYDALNGSVSFDGREARVNVDARAYDASAHVEGVIAGADDGVRYDLRGHASGVDLRALPPQVPIPPLESRLAGDYSVAGTGARLEGTLVFDASEIEGATIGGGSEGAVDLRTDEPRYRFSGDVAGLDAGRLGRALDVEAFQARPLPTDISGRIAIEGSGKTLAATHLNGTATLAPSTVQGVELDGTALTVVMADRHLTVSGTGRFASLDPGALSGRDDLKGEVMGTFDARATIAALGDPVTIDSVSADGSVTLGQSTIGPLTLESAVLEGRYADRMGDVTSLHVVGPDLEVTASGPLSLADTGDSHLEYHITHGRLDRLASLVGRDVAGRLTLDGTIAGNGTRLTTTGTSAIAGLKVDTTIDALEAGATFDASLDDLEPETLRVKARLDSTLTTLFGHQIRSATADVTYAGTELQFETTLNEVDRSVTGGGRVRFLPDAREVRVERLSVTAGGQMWTSAGPQGFTARFGRDGLLTLSDVALTSGNQRVEAAGTVSLEPGVPGDLNVSLEQIDLAQVPELLLLQRTLGGALDATGRVTGDAANRVITGKVAIKNGLVDGFVFQSLAAALDYANQRVELDATLLQAPGSQLTAVGTVALPGTGAASGNAPMDLQVTTNGIDLALLQAVSTSFESVTGTLLADLHVTGTAEAPRLNGRVAVQDGAFTLAATGVAYTGAALDVALDGDMLRINRLHLLDSGNSPLDGTGTLTVEGRRVQGIDVSLEANDFKVLNNEFGDVAVNTTLTISGMLLTPTIAGQVHVHSGRLEVDTLVDRFTSSAYAESPTTAETQAVPDASSSTSPPTGMTLDLDVDIPGNLILRGNDIKPANATVAFGNLNITVGGEFTIHKTPGTDAVLSGTMQTIRGDYDFQGRRFSVLRDGTIAFRAQNPIDPALAVEADRAISGIVAHVNIGGSMRMPSISLSSEPPLDESDILSLIIFNQPVNRLGESQRQTLGSRAVGLASGLVVAPISDSLERALDVDLFEIESVSDEGGGPSVTVGEQVGERLFLKVQQMFGAQDTSEFQLEYQLADFLRLKGSIAEGRGQANRSLTRRVERAGIDLVMFFSY